MSMFSFFSFDNQKFQPTDICRKSLKSRANPLLGCIIHEGKGVVQHGFIFYYCYFKVHY